MSKKNRGSNPNSYDEDRFNQACNDLESAVEELWEAGSTEDDIDDAFDNAKANAGVEQ